MSEPTVRWSYSFEANGVRTKSTARYASEPQAIAGMALSANIVGRSRYRLRRLKSKPKPKVVAKTVATYASSGNCICCDQADGDAEAGKIYRAVTAVAGKRICVTVEELES